MNEDRVKMQKKDCSDRSEMHKVDHNKTVFGQKSKRNENRESGYTKIKDTKTTAFLHEWGGTNEHRIRKRDIEDDEIADKQRKTDYRDKGNPKGVMKNETKKDKLPKKEIENNSADDLESLVTVEIVEKEDVICCVREEKRT